jgi:hypothetical protein
MLFTKVEFIRMIDSFPRFFFMPHAFAEKLPADSEKLPAKSKKLPADFKKLPAKIKKLPANRKAKR